MFLAALLLITINAYSHTLNRGCYSQQTYSIIATQGASNGKIEVTVYTNSSMNTVSQPTRTFSLNSSGAVNFTANQPSQTNTEFVVVKWFKRNNNGTYSEEFWNNGSSTSSITTGTNACTVLPVRSIEIFTKRLSNTEIEVTFNVLEETNVNYYKILISFDGVNFQEKAVIFADNTVSKGVYKLKIKL